jgi:phosphomannomutase
MAVTFGTSGLRGLAVEFTDDLCAAYVVSFLKNINSKFEHVYLAMDLRDSSPRIAAACSHAINRAGWTCVLLGNIPTPALAAYSLKRSAPGIMITGSHIPEEYNGIKFYRPDGEFLKSDETPVRLLADRYLRNIARPELTEMDDMEANAIREYESRYLEFFGSEALQGLKVGVDLHSAVGRDILVNILTRLGAEVLPFRRLCNFIAVDTEALDQADLIRSCKFIVDHELDAVLSTDGDGDRPLVIDDKGNQVNGDILGILTAKYLNAKTVVTPLSTTSALEETFWFENIRRTRIGSPYVVEEMANAELHPVVGFEANGGFLIGDDVTSEAGQLSRLATRDSVLPIVALLSMAKKQGTPISQIVDSLPKRYMRADRIKEISSDRGASFLKLIETSKTKRLELSPCFSEEKEVSIIDGVRITLQNGDTVHFRQSGNAPEMRIYIETDNAARTKQMLTDFTKKLEAVL